MDPTTTVKESNETNNYSFSNADILNYLYSRSEVKRVNIKDHHESTSTNNNTVRDCSCCGDGLLCTKHKHLETLRMLRDNKHISRAMNSFPPEAEPCTSSIPGTGYGVRAVRNIPEGTWIGPYEGRHIKPEDLTADTNNSYMWEVFDNGCLAYYLDGSDEETSSWMRYIRCARHKGEQNTSVMQYFGNIYYRVYKEIPPGHEILVWYDETCPHYLGIPLKMQDIGTSTPLDDTKVSQNVPVSTRVSPSQTTTGAPNIQPPRVSSLHPMMTAYVPRYPPSVRPPLPRYQVPYPVVSRDTLLHSSFANSSNYNLRELNDAYTAAALYGNRLPYMVNGKSKSPSAVIHQTNVNNALISHGIFPYSRDTKINQSKTDIILKQSIRSPELSSHQSKSGSVSFKIRKESSKDSLDNNGNIRPNDYDEITYPDKIEEKQINVTSSDNTISKFLSQIEEARLEEMKAKHKALQDIIQDKQTSQDDVLEINLWKCRQCDKSFAQQQILQLHICPSIPEKPYKCTYCPEAFAQPSDLRTHAVCHNGKKPFKCGFCSRLFAGSTTLNNHIRTHTGERPFGCEKCGKEFTQASQLSRHKRALFECK